MAVAGVPRAWSSGERDESLAEEGGAAEAEAAARGVGGEEGPKLEAKRAAGH